MMLKRIRYNEKLATLECAKDDLKQLDIHRTLVLGKTRILSFAALKTLTISNLPPPETMEQVHSDGESEAELSEDGLAGLTEQSQHEEPNDGEEATLSGETEFTSEPSTKKKEEIILRMYALLLVVQSHKFYTWVETAEMNYPKIAKQYRERYHQKLEPSLNHKPVTPKEGAQIEHLVSEIGKRWAQIAQQATWSQR
ncbi:myb-like DNA-binding domain-containing protein [Beauveria bassiana ARSEF 2860]|uniref:Myb-like DNA-binding domain-containing protein n=1 Tax=Beauveria bassiana (strain ARSEF 2860) TaxID=655819 RepID=J5J461_BEAB2|nr:myb-like DNA-binding domain-containing protein [Beauveria bassiana ARSEF 2860]EJP61488.1 myb-like DNA-binding domain-containing protein [Beauveria bassiana ARSEF 2860]